MNDLPEIKDGPTISPYELGKITNTDTIAQSLTRETLDAIMKMFRAPSPQKIIRDPVTGQHYAYDPSKFVLAPADMKIDMEVYKPNFGPVIVIPWGAVKHTPVFNISVADYGGDYTPPKRHQDHARWTKKSEQALKNARRMIYSTKHNRNGRRKRHWINRYIQLLNKACR